MKRCGSDFSISLGLNFDFLYMMQLAERESQLADASHRQALSDQEISQLRAELADQNTVVQTLQAELASFKESQDESALVNDLDRLLSDPDHLPLEAEQLMSSLRRGAPANPDHEPPGQLQKLRRQLQVREEELQKRDSAMQQLLRGAERIEEAQKNTLQQLATAQIEVSQLPSKQPLLFSMIP